MNPANQFGPNCCHPRLNRERYIEVRTEIFVVIFENESERERNEEEMSLMH